MKVSINREKVNKIEIMVKTTVNEPVEKVWKCWTEPTYITKWNSASEDWHTPFAENDLRVGGSFISRMEAKDGSLGFDFSGTYDEVKLYEVISYVTADGRKVKITFIGQENETNIIETFEAENTNSIELQQKGWQAILDNFKKFTEQTTI